MKKILFFCVLLSLILVVGCSPFDPKPFLPEHCIIGPAGYLLCSEFAVESSGTAQVTLENIEDKEYKSVTFEIESLCEPQGVDFNPTDKLTFTCQVTPGEKGKFYKHNLKFISGTEYKHESEGRIFVKYN